MAHEIWRERGSPAGSDVDIWLEAERQLTGREITPPAHRDSIPAELSRFGTDDDLALNPDVDTQLRGIGSRPDQPSPTSL